MTNTTDDRKLIAAVLEHDRKATDGPWEAAGPWPKATVYATPRQADEVPVLIADFGDVGQGAEDDGNDVDLHPDQNLVAAYRTAAPELARRFGALLNALEETWSEFDDDEAQVVVGKIKRVYARNLAKGSKP